MEAASARAAARDRWTEFGRAPSQLHRFISACCSPENYEPNLALALEISDLINSKKGTAPREAATAIVSYINHRNPNVALLALHLLDICVKNCGYPFQLQVSTKEFLNELVRRFPERPPIRATRVQGKILEAIEEWRLTICETSRHKEDLGFIRDMHRLLSYKGYIFPEVRREDAAVLNPSDNLKSAEEMEEEDREAQSAKLQELIRRGTPHDLQEANRLMKVMAGYDTRSKTDYRAKAAEDIGKIQAKARLLEDRLAAFQPGDAMEEGDVFSELASALQSAQPKIQKMCEEESEDQDAVAKLFEINDSIHRTVERYKLMKKGDMEGAAKVAAGGPAPSQTATVTVNAANELSLIDFEPEPTSTNGNENGNGGSSDGAAPAESQTGGLENDLLGLDLGGEASTYGQGGALSLGFGTNSNIPGPALLSSMTEHNSASGSFTNPTPPFSGLGSMSTSPAPQTITPSQPSAYQSPQQTQTAADPFASLGASFTPSQKHPIAPPPKSTAAGAADEDEWSFSSSLPPAAPSKPAEPRATISNTSVRIDYVALRGPSTRNAISICFSFTNNTATPINDLHFELAVTKGFELQLKPQTGRELAPKQSHGITQEVVVFHAGDRSRKVDAVKLRWRAAYRMNGEAKNETGEVKEVSVA